MKFKDEDEAYEAYLEYVQSEMPFDINDWERDWSEGFFDWLDNNNVEFEE
jgi:hypothetical protein